jgi:hypothetical protein
MTQSPQVLKDNEQVANMQFSYWNDQYTNDLAAAQQAWATSLSAADSFQQLLLIFLTVIPACMDQVGDLLGSIGASLNYASAISSYSSSMQTFFNEGGDISESDAQEYVQEMQDLYGILNDPNTPLSNNDRQSLLDMLNGLASSYGKEVGITTDNCTPMDLNADMIVGAQKGWAQQANDPTNPHVSGNFTAASDAFQQMNNQCTGINNTLTYEQKFWADMMNQFESVFKEFTDYYTNVNSYAVNSTKSV